MFRFFALLSAVAIFAGVGYAKLNDKTIVETAIAAPNFKTLVAAVKAADLVETLNSEGPFTVFAPSDEAFDKLGKETIEAVLKDKAKLTGILKYHVIKGKVMAKDAIGMDGKSAETLNGKLPITVKDGSVYVGKAKVVKADIACKNGVIHVIDSVLLPS